VTDARVTPDTSDSLPRATDQPEPAPRVQYVRPWRVVPTLVTLATVVLAVLLSWAMWEAYMTGPGTAPFAPMSSTWRRRSPDVRGVQGNDAVVHVARAFYVRRYQWRAASARGSWP
jgi:hypothetical protein